MTNSPKNRNGAGAHLKAAAIGEPLQSLQADAERLRADLCEERAASIKMAADIEALQHELERARHALEPRLMSILSLRPLRYVLSERNRIKRSMKGRSAIGDALAFPEGAGKREGPRLAATEIVEQVRAAAASRKAFSPSVKVQDIGIAVFAHNRAHHITHVLHALDLQGASGLVHVFIDGDHGKPEKRAQVDLVQDCVYHFPVKGVHRNRGNFGFRKMMLLTMRFMMERYDRIIFLEDDCFPVGGAIDGFDKALSSAAEDDRVFSVYGNPFGMPNEERGSTRFQSWGWATTTARLEPIWRALMECYLQTEDEYLSFVSDSLTPEIEAMIDITPGRQPSETLKKFFAWDETLCLLAAMHGMRHQMAEKRLIYNFGAGQGASHFHHVDYFRQPPFNMVSEDEIWDHF